MNELNTKDLDSLKKAIELQKKYYDDEALRILRNLLLSNPNNSKVIGFLGLILSKTNQSEEAILYLEKATKMRPKNELYSLSLYVNYVEVEKFEMALKILFSYLENNPANLFKDTLEELLEGLLNGYAINFKDKIIFYAQENCITIPEELQ